MDVIDPKELWSGYTYFSSQTKGIVEHLNSIARTLIEVYNPPKNSLVIDIGSNDGSLLKPFKDLGYPVLGIDPSNEVAKKAIDAGIRTVTQFMTKELAQKIRDEHGLASIITAFNVFAHAYDMSDMIESIRHLLAKDGIFVFECQYLMDIIDNLLLGTIFHEHISHHSLKPLMKFLEKHGLEIIDVQRVSIQKGSIIGTVQHIKGPRQVKSTVADLLGLEEARKLDTPQAMQVFSDKLENLKRKVSDLICEYKCRGAVFAGYGAARSGPTIMAQFELGSVIQYIFDDHPFKVGCFSPHDGAEILPTSELNRRKPDVVFILAWIHAKKIIENNYTYLKNGGVFVVFFPDLQVIDANTLTRSRLNESCLEN